MNNYSMLKKMFASVLLCSMMLSWGGCTVMLGGASIGDSIASKDTRITNKIILSLIFTSLGAIVDYSWYSSAQKYQAEGESKSKAYAKGGLVALGVFVVVLYVTLLGHAIYVEKIKKKY